MQKESRNVALERVPEEVRSEIYSRLNVTDQFRLVQAYPLEKKRCPDPGKIDEVKLLFETSERYLNKVTKQSNIGAISKLSFRFFKNHIDADLECIFPLVGSELRSQIDEAWRHIRRVMGSSSFPSFCYSTCESDRDVQETLLGVLSANPLFKEHFREIEELRSDLARRLKDYQLNSQNVQCFTGFNSVFGMMPIVAPIYCQKNK